MNGLYVDYMWALGARACGGWAGPAEGGPSPGRVCCLLLSLAGLAPGGGVFPGYVSGEGAYRKMFSKARDLRRGVL